MTTFDLADDRFKSITLGPDGTPVAATVVLRGGRTPAYLAAIQAVEDGTEPGPEPPPGPQAHQLDVVWGPETTGMSAAADTLRQRVTGGYWRPGMPTDDLLALTFAKWTDMISGWQLEMLRAQVWSESSWSQHQLGDDIDPVGPDVTPEQRAILEAMDPPLSRNPANGRLYQSYSLIQTKVSPWLHGGCWPWARDDPSWALDYHAAYTATAARGLMDWMGDEYPAYKTYATKIRNGGVPTLNEVYYARGCWYSGGWADAAAKRYITTLKSHMSRKPYAATIAARLDPWRRNTT